MKVCWFSNPVIKGKETEGPLHTMVTHSQWGKHCLVHFTHDKPEIQKRCSNFLQLDNDKAEGFTQICLTSKLFQSYHTPSQQETQSGESVEWRVSVTWHTLTYIFILPMPKRKTHPLSIKCDSCQTLLQFFSRTEFQLLRRRSSKMGRKIYCDHKPFKKILKNIFENHSKRVHQFIF